MGAVFRSHMARKDIRFLLLLALTVLLILSTEAASSERTWIFSGAELKSAIEGNYAPETSDPETRRLISAAKASAYIAGVADFTSGGKWCGAGEVAPHEIKDRVYTYLGDLSAEQLNANAATLVLAALEHSLPCQTTKN